MSKLDAVAVLKAISSPNASSNLQPGPPPRARGAKAALRHCNAAWQRAFDAYLEKTKRSPTDKIFAADKAGSAYRNAMPLLAGIEGARDFIACTAHGILIGSISSQIGSQLLYAAQLALAVHQCQPDSARVPLPPQIPPTGGLHSHPNQII
jgi:hypothetical protein